MRRAPQPLSEPLAHAFKLTPFSFDLRGCSYLWMNAHLRARPAAIDVGGLALISGNYLPSEDTMRSAGVKHGIVRETGHGLAPW